MQKFNFGSSSAKRHELTKGAAESMAIEVLGFLTEDLARLDRFLALSGLGLDNLRGAAGEPGFLAALLDHLASDEALLLAFAAKSTHDPSAIVRARKILSKSEVPPCEAIPFEA